jgi:hypothetical protein
MLSFVKRLAYRDRVLDQLDALLLMYPPGRQFSADFPGLPARVRVHFGEGLSATGSALQLAAEIIAGLVDPFDADARREVLAQVTRLRPDELAATAARSISRQRSDQKDKVAFVAELIGVAIFMAQRMRQEGTAAESEYRIFIELLDRALPSLAAVADRRAP